MFFHPWIVLSEEDLLGRIDFHVQMITDFKTIEMVGGELLNELSRQSA